MVYFKVQTQNLRGMPEKNIGNNFKLLWASGPRLELWRNGNNWTLTPCALC
jgi:hypothetical protein